MIKEKAKGMRLLETEFCLERDGFLIRGTEYRRNRAANRKLSPVVLSHGFMSSQRETQFYARQMAGLGFACYTFDFVGGTRDGKSTGSMAKDMTVWTEVSDLERVMHYVTNLDYIDPGHLILVGCSQGGVVSALTAARHPEEVERLILLYPALCIADDCRKGKNMFFQYDPEHIPDQIPADFGNPLANSISRIVPAGKKMVLNGEYARSMVHVDLFHEIEPYHGKVLIIHGTEDKVVESDYAERAYRQYRTGRGKNIDPGCHLVLIREAPHGLGTVYRRAAAEEIRRWLSNEVEVLTISVHLTGREIKREGLDSTTTLPFTGSCDTEYFKGKVMPGAADVQKRTGLMPVEFNADYTLSGKDRMGQDCKVSIHNHFDGKTWTPTIHTDSEALGFINHCDAKAFLEQHKDGPTVRIYIQEKDIR